MPSTSLATQLAQSRVAERARIREIQNIADSVGAPASWVQTHIDAETRVDNARKIALSTYGSGLGGQVQVGSDRNLDTVNQAMQDAILQRCGVSQFARLDGRGRLELNANGGIVWDKPHERAACFARGTLLDMGREYLLALGCKQVNNLSRSQLAGLLMSRQSLQSVLGDRYRRGSIGVVQLAQATGDFPFLLADAMGKALRQQYALASQTWTRWCGRHSVPDFKDIKRIQLSEASDLVKTPEGDDVAYVTLGDSAEIYALSTYTSGLKFTRRALINDDLSALKQLPKQLGNAAARNVEKNAIAVLTGNAPLSDGHSLFSTAHGNTASVPLTSGGLGVARSMMSKQTAPGSNEPIDIDPGFILVPASLRTDAEQILSSAEVRDTSVNTEYGTTNPFGPTTAGKRLEVLSSARLDNNSTTQWYMIASPTDIDGVEVAFLEGEEAPEILEEDDFDSDSRKIKVRHSTAAKAIDYRGVVRSSGAG